MAGNTFNTGKYVNAIFQDSSNNIGIGAAPSGTYKFEVTGTAKISGITTFGSTLSNGTYAYTLPSATGTLALTSAIPTNPVGGTGTTNYLPKFTASSTIGNSLVYDDGTNVGIGTTSPNAKLEVTSRIAATNGGGASRVALNIESNGSGTSYSAINSYNYGTVAGRPLAINESGGNVMINTTTDSGYKLDVNGTGRFSGDLTINGTNKNVQLGPNTLPTTSSNLRHYFAGAATFVGQDGVGEANVGNNFYYNAAFLRRNGDYASNIRFDAGNIYLQVAANGAANSAITWTNALTLASTGAATFSSSVTAGAGSFTASSGWGLQGYSSNSASINAANGSGYGLYINSGTSASSSTYTAQFVGNGSTQFYVRGDGNVGIGTSSPYSKFEIASSAANYNTAPAILFTDTSGASNSNRWIVGNIATDYGYFNIASAPTSSSTVFTPRLTITNGGNVLIGTTTDSGEKLKVVGDVSTSSVYPNVDNASYCGLSSRRWIAVYAVNGTIQTSDRNLKTNIIASDLGLDYIMKLNPVSYNWKQGDNKKHYGLIAQEVEEIAEFGGIDKKDDTYGLNYSEFIAPLIKSTQELKLEKDTEIAELRKQIEELKQLINK